jgi:iron(III) transport system substrate-binding protein
MRSMPAPPRGAAAILLCACRIELGPPDGAPLGVDADGGPSGEVWIYTSMYPPVIDALEELIAERYPAVEPRWYQAGSEKVAQRAEAEWSAGGSPACLLMTSDPFWYARLEQQGRLQPHLAPNVLKLDRALVDDDGTWVTARQSLVVLAVSEAIPEGDRPEAFQALAEPAWSGKITSGDPLASGSSFTWLAFAIRDHGWDYVNALRANGLVAAGGNSAVLNRVQTGERPVGVILLENLLTAEPPGVATVFPTDGAVVVPGPLAMTADCRNPVAAGAIYDLVLSEEGQRRIVAGDMYGVLPTLDPPAGAPPLSAIAVRPWTPGLADEIVVEQSAIKDRWTR